ncbi:MAG TPA: capsular biosynthesis protein CpsH [Spirochaetota bacterium]
MSASDLAGKKILFIAPHFFNYEIEIVRKLEKLGATVFFYDERPSNGVFAKTMIRLNRRFLHRAIVRHFARMMNEMKGIDLDYIFIIKGETISESLLGKMRTEFSRAKIHLYLWDSLRNNPNIVPLLPLFDRALTFDIDDARANTLLSFRPLFYLDEYADAGKTRDYLYDVCFVGTVHSDRYAVISRMRTQLTGAFFFYMFFHTRLLYIARRIFDRAFRGTRIGEFRFTPLGKDETVKLIASSRAVLDIQHPRQTGLTMRTIEILGARRKLITTNAAISQYDFYRPENICIVDREKCQIDESFLRSPFVDPDPAVYEYYSMGRWIADILG